MYVGEDVIMLNHCQQSIFILFNQLILIQNSPAVKPQLKTTGGSGTNEMIGKMKTWDENIINHKVRWRSLLLGIQLLHQFLFFFEIAVTMQLERFLIHLPHVFRLHQFQQIFLQMRQLFVFSRMVGQNWDSVFGLEYVRIGSVVDQHHTGQISVDDAQVLCVEVLIEKNAILFVESVPDILMVGIELIQNGVNEGLVSRSKSNNLKIFRHPFQKTDRVGSDFNVNLRSHPVAGLNGDHYVVLGARFILAMKKGFVDIDHQSFFGQVFLSLGQINLPRFYLHKRGRVDIKVIFENFHGEFEMFESANVVSLKGFFQMAEIVVFKFGKGVGGGNGFVFGVVFGLEFAGAAGGRCQGLVENILVFDIFWRYFDFKCSLVLRISGVVSIQLSLGLGQFFLQIGQGLFQSRRKQSLILGFVLLEFGCHLFRPLGVERTPEILSPGATVSEVGIVESVGGDGIAEEVKAVGFRLVLGVFEGRVSGEGRQQLIV